MRDAGRISFGGLLLLVLVSGALWAVVLLAPFWVDHLDVKEAVHAAHNLARQVQNDGILRQEIRTRTRDVATHLEHDDFGRLREVRGLGLTDDQIVIERNGVTGSVLIEVEYEREVHLKPTPYRHTLQLRARREGIPP